LFPTAHLPERVAAAKAKFSEIVDHRVANFSE
ncbi:MAG: hypothetical protein JWL73_947, partial [Actinomycetia bacterium]|nr:hypothetical protein [Actinomycetes bacterium]